MEKWTRRNRSVRFSKRRVTTSVNLANTSLPGFFLIKCLNRRLIASACYWNVHVHIFQSSGPWQNVLTMLFFQRTFTLVKFCVIMRLLIFVIISHLSYATQSFLISLRSRTKQSLNIVCSTVIWFSKRCNNCEF